MKKDSQRVNDESPLDKADYNINQWLIENTRTPRLPLPRNSILSRSNIENTQPFKELLPSTTHEGKDLLENGLVLLQYDKALSNLVGLAAQDADRKTVYIGQQGITAFNIEQSIRKDLVLCSSKLPIAIKAAETGYQVALSDYGTLHSCLDQGVVLLSCDDDLFAGKELVNLTAKEMRRLVDDAYRKEIDNNPSSFNAWDIKRINSGLTKAKIIAKLETETEQQQILELSLELASKLSLSYPHVYSKISIYKTIENATKGKLPPEILDSIISRVFYSVDKRHSNALELVQVDGWGKHTVETVETLVGVNIAYSGLIIVQAPTGYKKTEVIGKRFINHAKVNNKLSLAIAHRVSLINDLCDRLELQSYAEIKEDKTLASVAEAVGMCVHSATHKSLTPFINKVTHVFIDEISQVIRCLADSTFAKKRHVANEIYNTLRRLIAEAECVIVADANIDQIMPT
jgi:putative DNA primase/helicase